VATSSAGTVERSRFLAWRVASAGQERLSDSEISASFKKKKNEHFFTFLSTKKLTEQERRTPVAYFREPIARDFYRAN
jgi:hypothetical protein